MQLTLTRVYRNDKDKEGNPLVFKSGVSKGKTYTKLGIQCVEYGDVWLSGFDAQWNANWKEGDKVEAEVEKTTSNGKEYLNLRRIDPLVALEKRVKALEEIVLS